MQGIHILIPTFYTMCWLSKRRMSVLLASANVFQIKTHINTKRSAGRKTDRQTDTQTEHESFSRDITTFEIYVL